MKHLIAVLIMLVALLGCRTQPNPSQGRYVLQFPSPPAAAQNPPSQPPSQETLLAELNRIKASLLDADQVKRHNGRCVVGADGKVLALNFDERAWMLNVTLKVYPVGELGVEQVSPRWIVVDTKMNREHRWFYTPSCPVAEDQMLKIVKAVYGL